MRTLILILFLAAVPAAFSQNDGDPANWCRSGTFMKDSPEFTIAKVGSLSGMILRRAYFFRDDRPDCPRGDRCLSSSYLVPGDEVVVRGELYGFACAWYPSAKGAGTVGWLRLEDIDFQRTPSNQPLRDWLGEWKYAENTLNLTNNKLAGWLNVTGNAFWKGLGDNIHIGELDGRVEPKGGVAKYSDGDDEFDCKATMQILGKYLIVSDNMQCGGANVTFSGIYRKTLN